MPFDPTTAKPEFSGFDPSTASLESELSPTDVARSGYLADPELDSRAYEEARQIHESLPRKGFLTGERFQDSAMLNMSAPLQGLMSYLKGDTYQYGKAVDRYLDDFARQETGVAGQVAEVAGALATPLPMGKPKLISTASKAAPIAAKTLSKIGKIGKVAAKPATNPVLPAAGNILRDALLAALYQSNTQVETEQRDLITDALTGGTASLAGRVGLGALGRFAHIPIPSEMVNMLASAGSRGITSGLPTNQSTESLPSAEELMRYYQQQLLLQGGQ